MDVYSVQNLCQAHAYSAYWSSHERVKPRDSQCPPHACALRADALDLHIYIDEFRRATLELGRRPFELSSRSGCSARGKFNKHAQVLSMQEIKLRQASESRLNKSFKKMCIRIMGECNASIYQSLCQPIIVLKELHFRASSLTVAVTVR